MCFHVFVEVLLHVEILAAPLAHELFVPDVDAHVGAQLVLVLKPLVTVLHWTQWRVLNAEHGSFPRAHPANSLRLGFSFTLKIEAAVSTIWLCYIPATQLFIKGNFLP